MQYKPRFFKWSKRDINLYQGVDYFCQKIKEPFKLSWALDVFKQNCKIFNPNPDEHIKKLLNDSNYFGVVYSPEPIYFPACLLFENTNFVIYPSIFEIQKNILILGDSLTTYCAKNLKFQDIKIYQEANNEQVKLKSIACDYQNLDKWFLRPPVSNSLLKEILVSKKSKKVAEASAGIDKIKYLMPVLELKKVYANYSIKPGDGIVFNVTNYHKGLFNITILKSSPRTNFQFRSIEFQMEVEKNIISSIVESGILPEVKKSLYDAYARMRFDKSWKNLAPMAWLKYIKKSKKLKIVNIGHDNFLFYGEKSSLKLNQVMQELNWRCSKMENLSDILETANCEANIEILKAYALNYIDEGNKSYKDFFKFIFKKFNVSFLKNTEKLLFDRFAKDFWKSQLAKSAKKESSLHKICRKKTLAIYERSINFYQKDATKSAKTNVEKESCIYNILVGCEVVFNKINSNYHVSKEEVKTLNRMLKSMHDDLEMLKDD